MGFRYEPKVAGKYYTNSVVFATEGEASKAGYSKMFNWTQCEDYRVVPTDEPVSYRWDDERGAIHIATEMMGAKP